jgi:hypothetical protein
LSLTHLKVCCSVSLELLLLSLLNDRRPNHSDHTINVGNQRESDVPVDTCSLCVSEGVRLHASWIEGHLEIVVSAEANRKKRLFGISEVGLRRLRLQIPLGSSAMGQPSSMQYLHRRGFLVHRRLFLVCSIKVWCCNEKYSMPYWIRSLNDKANREKKNNGWVYYNNII